MKAIRRVQQVVASLATSRGFGWLRALSQRGHVPRAIWIRLPVGGSFDVRTPTGSFRYRTPQDDSEARHLFWRGVESIEPESMPVFAREAAQATTVIDIGANRGTFTLTALAASPTVEVIAIEPSPGTFRHLSEQIELNHWSDRVQLVNAAAADRSGTMAFHVPRSLLANSARLVDAAHRSAITGEVIDVEVLTIDELTTEADVVKIDVEGAEHLVLAGMTSLLEHAQPVVFIEVLPEADNAACQRTLERFGYRFFHLLPTGEVERPGLVPDPTRRNRNYVCRPSADRG